MNTKQTSSRYRKICTERKKEFTIPGDCKSYLYKTKYGYQCGYTCNNKARERK